MKQCTKCLINKDESLFYKSKGKIKSPCKMCCILNKKEYYKNNSEIFKAKSKTWYENNIRWQNNKEKYSLSTKKWVNENKEYIKLKQKEYRYKNKEFIYKRNNEYNRNKSKTDPTFKIRRNVSRLINIMLNGEKGGKSILKYLPYTMIQLKQHIESQFEPWMTWQNWGQYKIDSWNDQDPATWTWQLDHIIPQSKLLYTSMEDENFKKCWGLENLRPYSAKQNILGGNRRSYEDYTIY